MRIATWNLQRKRPASPNGSRAVDHLRSISADIAIVTEGWVDHLGPGFHHVDGGPAGIAHLREGERKVVIASRWPISGVRIDLDVPTPGRFVSATVETPEGPLNVLGICIPWFASRVGIGKTTNWEDHRTFLEALSTVVAESAKTPCLVAGDFNQRIPRSRQPREIADLLAEAFKDFAIPTAGELPETGRKLIDHIALSPSLKCREAMAWGGTLNGMKVSDHDGVMVVGSFS